LCDKSAVHLLNRVTLAQRETNRRIEHIDRRAGLIAGPMKSIQGYAPLAVKRATLQENGRADPGAVIHRKTLYA